MEKTIKTIAVMKEDSLYYLEGGVAYYENAHLVTDKAFNPDLGIQHIHLMTVDSDNPNSPQFRVVLRLTNGIALRGTIFSQDEGPGLRLTFLQDRYTDSEGQAQARDIIELPTAIRAQVLRYATTWTEDVEVDYTPRQANANTTSYRNNRGGYRNNNRPQASNPPATPKAKAPVAQTSAPTEEPTDKHIYGEIQEALASNPEAILQMIRNQKEAGQISSLPNMQ